MYDKTELRILELVYVNPGIHKRELSKRLHLGMPSIDLGLQKLGRLLVKKKSGNQINYYLNYSDQAVLPALHAVEYRRIEVLPVKIKLAVRDFLKELSEKPLMAVLFGSYARGDYTKHSDLDILLVFQKVENSKGIESTAKKVGMRTDTQLNPVYLDYVSFKQAFHDQTHGFLKNIKTDKLIVIGLEWWRQLQDEEA